MTVVVLNFNKAFAPVATETIDDQTAAEFQAIRTSLEKQVEELQVQAMQQGDSREQPPACVMSDEIPAIDNYISYKDEKTSVSMKIPFSTKWQNNDCDFAPTQLYDAGVVSFGPETGVTTSERDARLSIKPAISVQEMDTWYKDLVASKKQKRTINGMTVISYDVEGLGGGLFWEGFGRSYHYVITSNGWLTDAEAVKIIQSLKVTK